MKNIKLFGVAIAIVLVLFSMSVQAVDATDTNTTDANSSIPITQQYDGISILYFAMFNRIPDGEGLDYWRNMANQNGWSIEQIAQSFFDQNETKVLYPELYEVDGDRVDLITKVYQNLFSRYPDGPGLEYWERELTMGTISADYFLLAIINGAEDTDREFMLSTQKIAIELSKNGISSQENFREILSILFDDGESVAMDYIVYLSNEEDITYLKPTLSFESTPTLEGAVVNISTVDSSAEGLYIAQFSESTNRWLSIGRRVPEVGKFIALTLTDITDGQTIKIRFQNEDENIISGESSLVVDIPKKVANLADSDGDGILDRGDFFPNDPTENKDTDGDGVGDYADKCDNTPKGDEIAKDGCSPNTPAVIGGETSGTITEGDEQISKSLSIEDPDEGEAVMIGENISGSYGEFSLSTDGQWTYSMTADLAKGITKNEDFTVSSKDGVAVKIRVTVIGADPIVETTTTTE